MREDLASIARLVQSCHAVMESTRYYPPPEGCIPNLVVLSIPNEQKLLSVKDKLEKLGIRSEIFMEPDIGNQYTALATEPVSGETRRVFRNYKLLQEVLS